MKTVYLSIIVISLILIGASNFSTAHIEIPQISTSKSNFTDGDIIPINGFALPNSMTNIFLVNNHGNIQNSTQVKSNNTGYFNTSLGIPSHVIGGAWTLFAISGDSNFAMQLMVNFHGSNTPPFNSPSGFSPLKQFKLGIKPSYVQCRSDLQLIIKSEDGSPACVTSTTAQKLIERGWTANSQITYPCPTTDPSKISVDFPIKLPDVLPKGYSLQGIEQNGRMQIDAYYANKPLCSPDHNFQFHDIQLIVGITKQRTPIYAQEYYQLIPQLVGDEWDIPLGPNLIAELANKGITVQPLEINGYKGFGWVPWDNHVETVRYDVINHNSTASSLFFYNNNDQDVYSLIDFDHQSTVRLSNIARSIPP